MEKEREKGNPTAGQTNRNEMHSKMIIKCKVYLFYMATRCSHSNSLLTRYQVTVKKKEESMFQKFGKKCHIIMIMVS